MRNMLSAIEHLNAIQINIRGSIKAVKDQIDIGVGQKAGCRVKVEAVFPALIFNPLQLRFVVAIERVGNLLVGEQIEVNISGNCGG